MEKTKRVQNLEDLNKTLAKNLEEGVSLILSSKFAQALDSLKKCEKKLESLVNQGTQIDPDIILPTLHNTALCYQSLGNQQDCSAYLEACIYNIKKKTELSVVHSNTVAEKVRKIRYLCLLYIQLSDCYNKLNYNQRALEASKAAVKHCNLAIKMCQSSFSEAKHKKQSSSIGNSKGKLNLDIYSNSMSILQLLSLHISGKKVKKNPKDVIMRSALGVQRVSEWIFTLTFEKIIEIKPLTLVDLKSPHSMRIELSKDFMLDKVCLCVASYYILSKELFKNNTESLKGKAYLHKSIAIGGMFFPSSCPFLQSIIKDYSKKNSKKPKALPRSISAKDSRAEKLIENNANVEKRAFEVKKIPWNPQADRKHESVGTLHCEGHTQSESKICKNSLKSPCIEKAEPEPPLSEVSEQDELIKNLMISSNELYGNYAEQEVDKYEYMPLRRILS